MEHMTNGWRHGKKAARKKAVPKKKAAAKKAAPKKKLAAKRLSRNSLGGLEIGQLHGI
jgi:hypothetical protein